MTTDLGWPTNVKIGSTYQTMADVKIEPFIEFTAGVEQERNPCGGDSYQGSPQCRWTYPDRELTGEQFYQLRSLVGNQASATVFITVPTQRIDPVTYLPAATSYQAVMHWPAEGVLMTQYSRWTMGDEGLLFTNLVGQ